MYKLYKEDELLIETEEAENLTDGFHSFKTLYDHRFALYVALCKKLKHMGMTGWTPGGEGVDDQPWRSKTHSDGSEWKGWFLLGIGKIPGNQITYHLPESRWEECSFAETLEMAPGFDGHSGQEVLDRLSKL
jgi:hypothetical protein